jgi:hypothetical protein
VTLKSLNCAGVCDGVKMPDLATVEIMTASTLAPLNRKEQKNHANIAKCGLGILMACPGTRRASTELAVNEGRVHELGWCTALPLL